LREFVVSASNPQHESVPASGRQQEKLFENDSTESRFKSSGKEQLKAYDEAA